MNARIFLSFDVPAEHLEEFARQTQDLGIDIAGRFTPLGGPLELVPDLRQQLRVSDAVVVVFGGVKATDDLTREVEWSYEDAKGLVGVRLEEGASTPNLLYEAGAEILNWSDAEDRARLGGAIRAAVRGAQLMERARNAGTGSGAACARPKLRGR